MENGGRTKDESGRQTSCDREVVGSVVGVDSVDGAEEGEDRSFEGVCRW